MANATISKVTKTMKFNAIKDILIENDLATVTIGEEVVDLTEMIDKEIASIAKHNAKKAEKVSAEDTAYIAAIVDALAEKPLTPTELMAKAGLPNTQKVASLVKGMSNVTKTVKGKKVTYSLITE